MRYKCIYFDSESFHFDFIFELENGTVSTTITTITAIRTTVKMPETTEIPEILISTSSETTTPIQMEPEILITTPLSVEKIFSETTQCFH